MDVGDQTIYRQLRSRRRSSLPVRVGAPPDVTLVELLIGLLDQSLGRVPQVSEFMRDAVLGVLILAAVIVDGLLTRRFTTRRMIMAQGGTA